MPSSKTRYLALVEEAVRTRKAGQDPVEFAPLLGILARRRPRRVLEIGTFHGGTLWLLARVAADDATLVSVDDRSWSHGGIASPEEIRRGEQRVYLLEGDSHERSVWSRVAECFGREKVDFLLIDGDHSYEGAKADWEIYSPLVRPGGLIALHDVLDWAPDRGYGVHRLWAEIKESHRTREFFAPADDAAGLGVVEIS